MGLRGFFEGSIRRVAKIQAFYGDLLWGLEGFRLYQWVRSRTVLGCSSP